MNNIILNREDIEAATYKKYNANNRGNNAPDCVKRAISMAFNMDYNEVSKLLLAEAKKKRTSHWNTVYVFEPVIYALGGQKGREPDTLYRVSEFIDEVVPSGVVIMETGPHPCHYNEGNHLTCAVDGVLYDSWDSSKQFVAQYYLVEGISHDFTDIQDHLDELLPEGIELIGQLWEKYREKYNLPGELTQLGNGHKQEFGIYFTMKYVDDAVSTKFFIDCVFTPTMDIESARKKMKETIKIRMYDRFYEINKQRAKKSEGDRLFEESGYTEADKPNLYLYTIEKRFVNTLPGWIRPFITYVSVQSPGQWSDSYELRILPIKGDPEFPRRVEFHGYTADDVRDEINRYKKNFERVDEDYSYYEEY